MKLRESTEQAKGWLETAIPATIISLGKRPAVDYRRVQAAMAAGWRYEEPNGPSSDDWLGALQTSAWFTVDSEVIHDAVLGAMPEHDELPPLPFQRMAYDALDGRGGDPQFASPLFAFKHVRDDGDMYAHTLDDLQAQDAHTVNCMTVFEIQQGQLWDAILDVTRIRNGQSTLFGFHITPGGHTADYDALFLRWASEYGHEKAEEMLWFDKQLGTLVWGTAVTAAHLITASNVINRRILPVRQQRREWQRQRYGPVEPRIYRVDIVEAPEVRDGHTDREYHVRWMVRGHYRHTAHGDYKHPRTGAPATWVKAYVKGPAGAPWKGRPKHVMGAT